MFPTMIFIPAIQGNSLGSAVLPPTILLEVAFLATPHLQATEALDSGAART